MSIFDNVNYDEAAVPTYELPPLLNDSAWPQRREEILELYRRFIFGRVPEFDYEMAVECVESGSAFAGKAQRKQLCVSLNTQRASHSFEVLIYTPTAHASAPAFVGLNFDGNHTVADDPQIRITDTWVREKEQTDEHQATGRGRAKAASRWQVEHLIDNGYALVTCYYGDIDPDFDDGFKNGVHALAERSDRDDEWGTIAAWSWGVSRIADVLQNEASIDANRLAVIGHSRLGKTALWAGAQDERFKLIISNNSGCGGAALSRRCFGETIEIINTSFPHWFAQAHKQYNGHEADLPVDQHMLLALQAPRPIYVASAVEDEWADPHGEFKSLYHAGEVYRRLGKQDIGVCEQPAVDHPIQTDCGYHVRSGKHDVTLFDWQQYTIFADKHLK